MGPSIMKKFLIAMTVAAVAFATSGMASADPGAKKDGDKKAAARSTLERALQLGLSNEQAEAARRRLAELD